MSLGFLFKFNSIGLLMAFTIGSYSVPFLREQNITAFTTKTVGITRMISNKDTSKDTFGEKSQVFLNPEDTDDAKGAITHIQGNPTTQILQKVINDNTIFKAGGVFSAKTFKNRALFLLNKFIPERNSQNISTSQNFTTLLHSKIKYIYDVNETQTIESLDNYAQQQKNKAFYNPDKLNALPNNINTAHSHRNPVKTFHDLTTLSNTFIPEESPNLTNYHSLRASNTSLSQTDAKYIELNTDTFTEIDDGFDNETNAKEAFSFQPKKPNFSMEEIMRIIKREYNIQIKILNELVLYFPVLFCDILLLVACWKLLKHIFQQISVRDQTNLSDEASQIYQKMDRRFEEANFSSQNPNKLGYCNHKTAVTRDHEPFPATGKTWFPPE